MPFSHHSHSGQFCAHAKDTLEDVVKAALAKKMHILALTEHMPREQQDLYTEEVGGYSAKVLLDTFRRYYDEARRLQQAYLSNMNILIGMEVDWIRPSSKAFIENLLSEFPLELFIGSVHHVHCVPIDYSTALFDEARHISGGSNEKLFEDYFDLQYEMLVALRPPIVGHFDLIRLKSDDPDTNFASMEGVRRRISRNLTFITEYGGVLELNSAALRKGLKEPYPNAAISKEFLGLGGNFTISDDSHGIDQIGCHYRELLCFAQEVGILQITYFQKDSSDKDLRFPNVTSKTITLSLLESHPFFA
ncbi:MAG: hypothetical protein L6R38_008728 [Xanthoria sp. 2 TBL-2021]|nr:MAG: hypothetical protein L6R38_008728 [Xanthoria sp. 2 TBL-2021]